MIDVNKLRTEFFNAQRALISGLFATNSNQAYVQLALDRMNRSFHALMLATFEPAAPTELSSQPDQELLCAYAVNMGDDWNGSKWQVLFVNGEPQPDPAAVGEFTRQMTADGWKVFSPQGSDELHTLFTPDGDPVYALYFFRPLPCRNEDPCDVLDLPDLQVVKLILSVN